MLYEELSAQSAQGFPNPIHCLCLLRLGQVKADIDRLFRTAPIVSLIRQVGEANLQRLQKFFGCQSLIVRQRLFMVFHDLSPPKASRTASRNLLAVWTAHRAFSDEIGSGE